MDETTELNNETDPVEPVEQVEPEAADEEESITDSNTLTETDASTTEPETETSGAEVLFVDYDSTTFYGETYEIQLIHTFTLGDILLATLLSVLIIVVLMSRLLGRSSRW